MVELDVRGAGIREVGQATFARRCGGDHFTIAVYFRGMGWPAGQVANTSFTAAAACVLPRAAACGLSRSYSPNIASLERYSLALWPVNSLNVLEK